jgi:transcriptional regulator with XRE-family HTH domain
LSWIITKKVRMVNHNLTVEEWEQSLGEQIRAARIAGDLDQARLAELANVSKGAVSNLERGRGSSLKTLVAIVRALDRTDWLESLAPPISVSPMQMLRTKHRVPDRQWRVRRGGGARRG